MTGYDLGNSCRICSLFQKIPSYRRFGGANSTSPEGGNDISQVGEAPGAWRRQRQLPPWGLGFAIFPRKQPVGLPRVGFHVYDGKLTKCQKKSYGKISHRFFGHQKMIEILIRKMIDHSNHSIGLINHVASKSCRCFKLSNSLEFKPILWKRHATFHHVCNHEWSVPHMHFQMIVTHYSYINVFTGARKKYAKLSTSRFLIFYISGQSLNLSTKK